jgi:hypothetical protein
MPPGIENGFGARGDLAIAAGAPSLELHGLRQAIRNAWETAMSLDPSSRQLMASAVIATAPVGRRGG